MSVIQYDTKDFDQLRNWLVYDVKSNRRDTSIKHTVINSQAFREFYLDQVRFRQGKGRH